MKVLVTGATGFIGHYVVQELLKRGLQVIATSVNPDKAKKKSWYSRVNYVAHDFYTATDENLFEKFHQPDKLIHLGWGNLSNFKSEDHLHKELPANEAFLKNLISNGLKDITCIGTCLEYGMQEGCLKEDMESKPTIAYPIAKNKLRIALEEFKKQHPFTLKWVRLFYMYGAGQSEKSILPLLEKAIKNGDEVFNMSNGDQLRDYLPVEKVSENIVKFALQDKILGIVNCSSNEPISVLDLVKNYIKTKGSNIKLNTGYYPYADYEPKNFWGCNQKLKLLENG